ncbi:MAG: uroporphyrinogen-III synthase, partial [Candidatus Omnitrophica bacterium]|nr:uroporphyrinogen-III synthase [Candidatus Omnitrophota bacterium]
GVSSFYAAAEVFGIPLTRRGIASGFIVVTGSEDPEKETEAVDWKHLAKFNGTIVILMGKSNLDDIVKKLRKFGMDPEIPCAVIYKGTTSQQKIAASTLRDIAKASSHLPAPSIVIIGDVVNMRDRHLIHSRPQNRAIYGANGAWPLSISLRETTGLSPRSFIKPLSGKRYLATATNGLNKDILKNFKELGADIDCVSMVKVLPNKDYSVLDRVISRVKRFDWLVFTSRHGALYFLERFYKLGGRETELKNRIACVGSGTANEFIKRDIRIELMPKKFTTKDLAIELSKRALKGKDIALLRTTVEKDYMKDILSTTGANIVDCIVYNIKELKSSKRLDKALLKRPDSILFLSPRSVDCFFNIISGRIKEDLKKGSPFVSIGPVTTNALKAKGINRIIEPEKHTVKGLAEACVAMADRGIA